MPGAFAGSEAALTTLEMQAGKNSNRSTWAGFFPSTRCAAVPERLERRAVYFAAIENNDLATLARVRIVHVDNTSVLGSACEINSVRTEQRF